MCEDSGAAVNTKRVHVRCAVCIPTLHAQFTVGVKVDGGGNGTL